MRLITRLNIGGPARQALLLTKELAGTHPTMLVAGTARPEEGELLDPDVPVRRVSLVREVNQRVDARAWREVRSLLQEKPVSLVHTHMAKAGFVGRSAATTVKPRPKIVHTYHGHVLDGYFRPAVEKAFIAAERGLARRSDALVAVSPQVRDSLLELGIGKPEQYRVIPLGFDLEDLLAVDSPRGAFRRSAGIPDDVPLVGIVGRLVPIKDVSTTLAAMEQVPEAHLAVVGDGELRTDLEREAQQRGIASRTHFTGWRRDVAEVMADLDVAVLSSRNEGTPVSLIEALAAGRPVVATDVGGVSFVVDDGVTGSLVRAGDHVALAKALTRLLQDPPLRAKMGAAGRERVRLRFGHERLTGDVRALYDELLG